MTEPLRLEGVFGVLPTAFHADGGLDLDGTGALVRANREAGVAGVTVLGVMGEAAELTEDERHRVVAMVVANAAPLPVIVGVSGESREIVSGRARDAAGRGVSAVMVSPAQRWASPMRSMRQRTVACRSSSRTTRPAPASR